MKKKRVYEFPIAKQYADKYLANMELQNDIILIHINHEIDDILDFHDMVSEFFYDSVFIAIPYTIMEYDEKNDKDIENTFSYYKIYKKDNSFFVCANGTILFETTDNLHIQIDEMIAVAINDISDILSGKRILFLEDGGYHYSIVEKLKTKFPELQYSIMGCIEQTRNGLRAYNIFIENHKLDYPVLTVARSKVKMRVESYYIAKNAAALIDEYLCMLNENLHSQNVLIIGYGAIGRHLSKILEAYGCRQCIYEHDPVIQNIVKEDGKSYINCVHQKIFENDLLIIGTTGNASFSLDMLESYLQSTSNTLTLVSVSSKQTEFRNLFENAEKYKFKEKVLKASGNILGKVYFRSDTGVCKNIRVVANGYPINFYGAWKRNLPISVIDMIYAEMIYLMKVIADFRIPLESTLYMLGSDYPFFHNIEEEIFNHWKLRKKYDIEQEELLDMLELHPKEEYLRKNL